MKKCLLRALFVLLIACLTPVVCANALGWGYGRLILGKESASAEYMVGWIFGLWAAPMVLSVGLLLFCMKKRS